MILIQMTKQVKRHWVLPMMSLLAGVLLLGSCRDELQDRPQTAQRTEAVTPLADYIGKVNMAIEADVEAMPDPSGSQSARALTYTLVDRTAKRTADGLSTPEGADYSYEFAPSLNLQQGDKIAGYLIFLHDDGGQTQEVFRQPVQFDVIEGSQSTSTAGGAPATGRNRIRYVGNVNFPAAKSLATEFNNSTSTEQTYKGQKVKTSRWKVMAMLGYDYSSPTANGREGTNLNKVYIGRTATGTTTINNEPVVDGNPSVGFTYGTEGRTLSTNVPYFSGWMDLYVGRGTDAQGSVNYTGINTDFDLRPEGLLLQYDLNSMMYDTQDIREFGLVSNVLDFRGEYDLNDTAIRSAYNAGKTHPAFTPDAPSMQGYKMYYTPSSEAKLSQGPRSYPWDMPTLSSNRPQLATWPAGGGNEFTVDQASVSPVFPLGVVGQGQRISLPWLGTKRLWTFLTLGGMSSESGARLGERAVVAFWAMPRSESRMPASGRRGTYFYASSYSLMTSADAYDGATGPTFDTDLYPQLARAAVAAQAELNQLEQDILTLTQLPGTPANSAALIAALTRSAERRSYYTEDPNSNPYRSTFPGALLTAYGNARELVSKTLTRNAREVSVTERTQPYLVLHQTNRTFTAGKVHHAQTVLQSDLLLSEVIYHRSNGQNYSLLEVYNPTLEPVDLTQYGIAKLIPSSSGNYLAFRSPTGQPVENLSEALVLPLTAILGNTDPFAGSGLSSLRPSGYSYDRAENRARPIYYAARNTTSYSETGPTYPGSWSYYQLRDGSRSDRPFYMLFGQSILLGGSGYVNNPISRPASNVIGGPDPSTQSNAELIRNNTSFTPGEQTDLRLDSIVNQMSTNLDRRRLRYAFAYADGPVQSNGTYGAGTLDFEPGQAYVLVRRTAGGWQIIDATGPIGPEGLAYPQTYSSFVTKMNTARSSGDTFSFQRVDGVDYPFIAPFRTRSLDNSGDTRYWVVRTRVADFTPGRRFHYWNVSNNLNPNTFSLKRTPLDASFTTYQNARPTRGL